jgi:hypothetical protein
VRGLLELEPRPGEESKLYEAVRCTACNRLHLVNLVTLTLLSEEKR